MGESFAKLAERQHGVVTRVQLRHLGWSDDQIDRRIAKGFLVPLHTAVYALIGTPDTFERNLRAALLAAGSQAAASHRAAAAVQRIGEVEPRLELSVPLMRRPRLEGVVIHRTPHLRREQTIVRGGVRVTTVARTICDLAAVLGPDELETTLDHALARHRVTTKAVLAILETIPANVKGTGRLRALLAVRREGTARAESPLELELHRFLRNRRFSGWKPQQWIAGCRVDAAFHGARLALQVDSYLHHSSRTDWAKDHGRHAALVAAGWRVLPVTKQDLRNGDELEVRLRAALHPVTLDA